VESGYPGPEGVPDPALQYGPGFDMEGKARNFNPLPAQQPAAEPAPAAGEAVSVGCIACARAHFATIAGTLKEAIRFAREDGLTHPEVQSRLEAAEEEVTNVERHDWTPEKTLNSLPREKHVIEQFFPDLRRLRQRIMTISSVDDLEHAAADAALLSTDFRLAVLELRGVGTGGAMGAASKPGGATALEAGCDSAENLESQGSP
jgi:hypothetical protein